MSKTWYNMKAENGVGEIHIYDVIASWGVNSRQFLKDLKALGDVTQLSVHINSPGGDVFEGQAIYSMLRQHKAVKKVYIDGLAASMGSVIAMVGDTIHMPANAMMMIHNPWSLAVGDSEDLRKSAETLDKITETLVSVYSTKTGLEPEEIKSLMDEETWFTADEAVAKGFADEVEEEQQMAAQFDLTKFRKVPEKAMALFAVTAGSTGKQNRPAAGEQSKKEHDMPKDNESALDKAPTQAELESKLKAVATQAADEEHARIEGINSSARQLGLDRDDDGRAIIAKLIKDRVKIDEARAQLIEARAKQDERTGPTNGHRTDETFDNPQFLRGAMATALAAQYSPIIKVDAKDPAREFLGMRPLALVAESARRRGVKNIPRDNEALAAMALHSTSDFPYLLADAGNKILLPAYQTATPTYRLIAAQRIFTDFKPHKFLRVGDFPDLLEVGEGGEIQRGTIGENRELVTMGTFARIVSVTRQMLINDDLSAFSDLATLAGRRVANWENAFVYALLAENTNLGPTLSDGHTLFKTNHNNYTSSGTAVNLPVELGKSRALMRKQTGIDGMKLNLAPRFLVGGA